MRQWKPPRPEGVVLDRAQVEAIGYTLKVMTRVDVQ